MKALKKHWLDEQINKERIYFVLVFYRLIYGNMSLHDHALFIMSVFDYL